MSLNPSSALDKTLRRQAGENLVAYKLARHGWLVVNGNAAGANSPNFDLIALRGERRVTIQVKAGLAERNVPLAGVYKARGGYYNTKRGPKADYVVAARLSRKSVDTCYVFTVEEAEKIAREHGDSWMDHPKSDGTRRKPFPIWVPAKKLENYKEAWEVIR